MTFRSMLFVPGDSPRKFEKGRHSGADALILDLEDSVAPANKTQARAHVAGLLDEDAARNWAFYVRINPFDTGLTLDDLAAVVKPGLDGIMVPKADGPADIVRVGHYLDALEVRAGMPVGSVQICVVATETPTAMFNLGGYAPPHPRLAALTWGAEDLAAAVGATGNKDDGGGWAFPYRIARTQCLFAAAAAGVQPIDTLYADFRDPDGLAADCIQARRDGFTGRIAIHPDQVALINAGFSPSEAEIAHARRLLDAFEAEPGAGVIGLDGKMYDIPHLKAARHTLASATSRTDA